MPLSPYLTAVDICNRGLQHLGQKPIFTLTDVSKNAAEVAFAYDKLRVAELRRSPWRFASRRTNLYALTATTYRFIPAVWAVGTTYAAGAIVKDSVGTYWISNVGANVANTPGAAPTAGYPAFWSQYFGAVYANLWVNTIRYDAGDVVYKAGTPNIFYICTTNFTAAAVDPASGAPWVPIGTVTANQLVTFLQPAGVGKTVVTRARNMFPLPNGFLRLLAPDPRVESTSQRNTSGALGYNDFQFEGNFIISSVSDPILLRFVADVSDVLEMDGMFKEMLAVRIAYEVCETLTQSNTKLQAVGAAYQKFASDARLINWLESGNSEPQETEYEATKGPQDRPSRAA